MTRPKASRHSRISSRSPTSTDGTDYVSVAIAYAEDAAQDRKGKTYCKWVRQAARRFLADLKRSQRKRSPPFYWSPKQANRACAFIEMLHHVEGTWGTATIRLEPSQIFFVVNLFGFRRHDGSRRFTVAMLAVARKNAKSTLAAAILLTCYCLENEEGPQIISAATTGSQARLVWRIAKRMVERSDGLRDTFTLESFANNIVRYEVGGSFVPINAKASSQDGLNPSALCFDELHAHKTRDLYDVLRSAAGARQNPLFLYTTTEGYESPGPWSEVRRFAWNVLEGVVEADHFLALYYALDDDDDDFDEATWIKANPLLGISIDVEKLREYATEARQQPGSLAEFRIKRLNRPSATASAWVNLLRWKRCDGAVDLEAMTKLPCYAALDLASTTDMTAWRLLWHDKDKDLYYTWGRYWVPSEAVASRTERGTAPYRNWMASGHITETEGNTTDYAVVEADIMADIQRFRPVEVLFDPWNATDIANRLLAQDVPMMQFRQGTQSYNPGFKLAERVYLSGKLSHGGDPVLTWNAANLVPFQDNNLNMKPDRKRSADKIDGMAALLMCFARFAVSQAAEQSYWE